MVDNTYPLDLLALLNLVRANLAALWTQFRLHQITLEQWQDEMLRNLMRANIAAAMLGLGSGELTPEASQAIMENVQAQLPFLRGFSEDITQAEELKPGWDTRAEMYGESLQVPFWRAVTGWLKLPAYPGDGSSECLTNDRCRWVIDWLDKENGDANVYWITESDPKVCVTCFERGQQWNPLRVRSFRYAS